MLIVTREQIVKCEVLRVGVLHVVRAAGRKAVARGVARTGDAIAVHRGLDVGRAQGTDLAASRVTAVERGPAIEEPDRAVGFVAGREKRRGVVAVVVAESGPSRRWR